VPLAQALQAQSLQELPRQAHKQGDHLHDPNVDALLAPALQGHDMGLVSEAGMPAVADPGSSVVRAAHKQGIAVVPLVGPSSPLLALAASGMNGQSFAFWGYLPVEASERIKAIERLAMQAQHGQAQLFIEVPHRNAALFQSLIDTLPPDLHLSLASNLTQSRETVRSLTVAAWRQSPPTLDKHQAVLFVVGRWPR
jgi:16S rRNA (cytidine1402-2'-O)-methyltransferase